MDNIFGAGGAGGGNGIGGNGPQQFFASLPPVTRIWLGSTIVITACANLDLVKWNDLDFSRWDDVMGRGRSGRVEAWRLITCFLCVGKFGFHTIIGLHLMTQISTRYEKMGPICTRRIHIPVEGPAAAATPPAAADHPNPNNNNNTPRGQNQQRRQQHNNNSPYYTRGESSDYVFALLFGMIGILLSNSLLLPKLPTSITHNRYHTFFNRHLTFYIVYIWSKQHPHTRVNLFGMPLAAAYLPFAYLVIGYALNNGEVIPVDILHGMFVGHVYFYLACVVPKVLGGGRCVICTPVVVVDLCHWLEGRGLVGGGGGDGGNDGPVLVDVDGVIGG
mmetsp:Transcript_15102/g.27292  ORF Transcript_15102/g.27292 Transcript_15102/m.27292 type:complete len:332 (+) Transcript_15102:1-996(+)